MGLDGVAFPCCFCVAFIPQSAFGSLLAVAFSTLRLRLCLVGFVGCILFDSVGSV